MTLLLDEPNAKIILEEKLQYIEVKLIGDVSYEAYQFAYEHALSFIIHQNIKKLLINEVGSATESKSRLWLISVFLPRLLSRVGLKLEVVIIRSGNRKLSISHKIVDELIDKLKSKFHLNVVQNEEKGRQLLIEGKRSKQEDKKS
ncbi:hypothetical protein V6R21_15695 [Limibacter armeniacum]|uniref:hypothetical protein n=1 Tax=Limibacter armeniacum TaxID=466084 RepID=UPI002FE5C389